VEGRYLRKLRAIGMMLGSIQTIERRPYFYLVILWARSDGNSHPAGIEVKRPILEKINFKGWGGKKYLRLKNDVFVGLKNYRLLQYDEGIFLHAVGCWTRPS